MLAVHTVNKLLKIYTGHAGALRLNFFKCFDPVSTRPTIFPHHKLPCTRNVKKIKGAATKNGGVDGTCKLGLKVYLDCCAHAC